MHSLVTWSILNGYMMVVVVLLVEVKSTSDNLSLT